MENYNLIIKELKDLLKYESNIKRRVESKICKYNVKKYINTSIKPKVTCEFIYKLVFDYYNIASENCFVKTRKREILKPRQISHYFAKKMKSLNLLNLSLYEIGKQIGDKDHSTVLHSAITVNNGIETNKAFKAEIKDIENMLCNIFKIQKIIK